MNNNEQQIKIKATYMRGGTSKGVFFNINDLPKDVQKNQIIRDKLFLRIIGSPDPYLKQIDGMGGASSSTSKVVMIEKSIMQNHDVDYYFGQVSINEPFIDWSGNCGNLSSAVGPFAIHEGLVDNVPYNGVCCVKIWQANIKKTIYCYVPIVNGKVQEIGDYEIDGVTFNASEILLEFSQPIDLNEKLFPTGNLIDELEVPNIGKFKVTMINAGIPTIFLNAHDLGYKGIELQDDINNDNEALKRFEIIRSYGALKMGLINNLEDAKTRQHTPKIAFVSSAQDYLSSSGKKIDKKNINLNVRALSMQKLHHAMMGTASVAIGVAACIEGTLVNIASGGGKKNNVTFGHPSGVLKVGAVINNNKDILEVEKATMSRSARIIMKGEVFVPANTLVVK